MRMDVKPGSSLQEASEALARRSPGGEGGVLQLAAGTYELGDETLYLYRGQTLQGSGLNNTTVRYTGPGKAIATHLSLANPNSTNPRQGISVRDLHVLGPYVPSAQNTGENAPVTYGIYMERTIQSSVYDCKIEGFGVGYYIGPKTSGYGKFTGNWVARCNTGLILAYNGTWVAFNGIAAAECGILLDRRHGLAPGEQASGNTSNVIMSNYFERTVNLGADGIRDTGFNTVMAFNRFDELSGYAIDLRRSSSSWRYGNRVGSSAGREERRPTVIDQGARFPMAGSAQLNGMQGATIPHNMGDNKYVVAITPAGPTPVPYSVIKDLESFTVFAPPGVTSPFHWAIIAQ